jgi:hypothetical protein
MYLTWGLFGNGFEVCSDDEGPDVGVSIGDVIVWFEAIAPKPGQGNDEVPQFGGEEGEVVVGRYPEEKILVRIRGAIEEKYRKYKRYIERGTISNDAPYIVAVNGCQLPGAFIKDDMPIAVRAVYPFGKPRIVVNSENFEVLRADHEYRDHVQKANGSPVETGIFLEEDYSGISA